MNELDLTHEASLHAIIADLRMENAELRQQLDEFRAGYIRQTNRLLIALDYIRTSQATNERREFAPCSNLS